MFISVQCNSGWTRRCVPPGHVSIELIPEFGRLVFDVPLHIFVAWTEIAFLRTRRIFVAPDANDEAAEFVFLDGALQIVLEQRGAADDAPSL